MAWAMVPGTVYSHKARVLAAKSTRAIPSSVQLAYPVTVTVRVIIMVGWTMQVTRDLPWISPGGSGLACTLTILRWSRRSKLHQTFRPTNSGVEDSRALEHGRSAYGWFACILASGQRPAPDDSKQEHVSCNGVYHEQVFMYSIPLGHSSPD